MNPTADLQRLAQRAETLLARLEALLPATAEPDWDASIAFRWRRRQGPLGAQGWLQPVRSVSTIRLADLKNVNAQKRDIDRNTRQFVAGLPANNVLLTGSRGTGKSSLIKACLNAHAGKGLRLIEVDKDDLVDLPDIVELVARRPERFIVFCDDLSFEEGEPGYKALKVALDGSIAAQSDNVLIYATSNRRHLMPEYMRENLDAKHQEDGEIHPGETTEEKISLSERFGLWVSFYPFRQDDYLAIAAHWLGRFGCGQPEIEAARGDALRFALERGSRSGRVAWQFAKDWAGSHASRRDAGRPRAGGPVPRAQGVSGDAPAQGAAPAPVTLTEVAVGVVQRADGAVLFGERVPGKPYPGWWELPGGKLEPGETVEQALARELHEELGLTVHASHPWVVREHAYPHATVRLHFQRVWDFDGEPQSREGQRFAWRQPDAIDLSPLLPASIPVLAWLRLPPFYAISNAAELGVPSFLAALERALAAGLRLVQLREKALEAAAFDALFVQVLARCRAAGAALLVNSDHGEAYAARCDGLHLTGAALAACTARPAMRWVAASCHDATDVARAGALGLDFAVLGPVLPTKSHPGAPALGWPAFTALARASALPLFALGGLGRDDLAIARRAGAHGVAALRGAWA
jgi:thiamine-phosphate diphosphorylase